MDQQPDHRSSAPEAKRSRHHHDKHAHKPDSPTDLHRASWTYTARKAVREFLGDGCTDLAAGLTYYAVLSIFPAAIALVSLLSLVGQGGTTTTLISMAEDLVPADAMSTLEPVLRSLTEAPAPGLGLILGLAAALWTASNYVNAFSRAMNRIYETTEGRPVWKLRPAMYLLTLVLLVLVALSVVLLAISGPVAEAIGSAIGLGGVAVTIWSIARWPVLLAVVVLVVALLYYFTPNVKQPKMRWISPGAIIAIVVAILASVGVGFYLANFGSYNQTYGSLAGVIIALLWIYVMNLALLFGAEVDAEAERSRQLQAGIEAEEDIQLPPRDTRASEKKEGQEREDVARGRRLRLSRGRSQKSDDS
ncbi:YihY/virulence factor BrkB family protein [Ruania suaedae]|uniref:YihY/virulence factor BrkB family protein n=1 Tax=Ruania suaedae TaxID=2897774 RepID=UPI001E4CCA3F|nr:YihY/virulence factor BrkB family protein [Ruania suaedae]UFU01940.1 YihY/virulence factor BrkB family protein [Ruania suaedae]